MLSARLCEPEVTVDGVKRMITRQCQLWGKDAKMCEYLRPTTLFSKTNFDNYYAAKDLPIKETNGTHSKQPHRNDFIGGQDGWDKQAAEQDRKSQSSDMPEGF